jgi:hypothetical protein
VYSTCCMLLAPLELPGTLSDKAGMSWIYLNFCYDVGLAVLDLYSCGHPHHSCCCCRINTKAATGGNAIHETTRMIPGHM